MSLVIQADIDAIERGETLWGTIRCLPKLEDIPDVFLRDIYNGTWYSKIVTAWYTGDPIPELQVEFLPGFKPDGKALKRFIMAHLNTLIPEHDHKIAGCAYLLSQIIELKE